MYDQNHITSRERYPLFDLPVDNLTMSETKRLLRAIAAKNGKGTVLSTINVNWVAESCRNPGFRAAIINSDLVVIDGKPLLWIAKLLGYPMQEVVPGSSLIQELQQDCSAAKPLKIFLFGGENDVAHIAMQKINSKQGGLKAVGALNPVLERSNR